MKRIRYISIFFLALISCKPSSNTSDASASISSDQPITTDSLSRPSEATTETLNIPPIENEITPDDGKENDQAPPVQPATKVCNPNFTKLSSPVRNHHIFYVSDFQPGEFKCWTYLEEHAAKICDGNSCIIYYVDSPKVKIENSKTEYMSAETLKSNGIGRFEFNGKYWEIKGASIWKRKGNGYGYYKSTNY